jgi:2-polyprenyl-6-methoxyphenol hydroxylase-like FAD-dependent oxidoreductase
LKVAVAGAGTAGLAAAIFLARQGHQVSVFEAIEKAEPVGAGFLIQPTGQSVLKELGLLDVLKKQGAIVETLEGFRGNFRCLSLRYRDLNPDFTGLGLHRANLQRALLHAAAAEGVRVQFRSPIRSFSQGQGEQQVYVDAAGKKNTADLFVIADGTRSHLRPLLNLRESTKPYPWGAFWLICESDVWPHQNILLQRYGEPWRTVGVLPTGRHPQSGKACYSIFWSIHRSEFELYRRDGLNQLRTKLRRFWPEAAGLFESSRHSNWSVAEYADTVMPRWHLGNTVVLGDAAHSMSPQLGQGANMALVDAKTLAEVIAETKSIPAALERYSELRKKHLQIYRWASRTMTPLYQSFLPLGFFRDAGTFVFGKIKPLYRQMLLLLSGYKGYPKLNQ